MVYCDGFFMERRKKKFKIKKTELLLRCFDFMDVKNISTLVT